MPVAKGFNTVHFSDPPPPPPNYNVHWQYSCINGDWLQGRELSHLRGCYMGGKGGDIKQVRANPFDDYTKHKDYKVLWFIFLFI